MLLERLYRDVDRQTMRAPAENDAPQRGNVTEVTTPRDRDVIGAHVSIVGRVQIDPAERGAVDGHPGVRRRPTDERCFALRFLARFVPEGAYIAAHIASGQSPGAQTSDHQVSEVLTDAAFAAQHFRNRRRDTRLARRVLETAIHLGHQLLGARQDGPTCEEAIFRVLRKHLLDAHIRGLMPEAAGFQALM